MLNKILLILLFSGRVLFCQGENNDFKIVSGDVNGVDPVVIVYLGETTGKTNAENKMRLPIGIRTGAITRMVSIMFEVKNRRWEATYYFGEQKVPLLGLISQQDKLPFFVWVKDKKGNVLQGAHQAAGEWLLRGLRAGNISSKCDTVKAIEEFNTELQLFPSSKGARVSLMSLELAKNPADLKKIYAEFDSLFKSIESNDSLATSLIPFYEKLGHKEKKDSLWKAFQEKYPKGYAARTEFFKRLSTEQNPTKKAELTEEWLTEWDNSAVNNDAILESLIRLYISAKNYDKAIEWLNKSPKSMPLIVNTLVNALIKEDEADEKILHLLDKPIEHLRNDKYEIQNTPKSMWERMQKTILAGVLDTYAVGLLKLGKEEDAFRYSEEAFSISQGASAEIAETIAYLYLKRKNYSGVIDVASKLSDKKGYSEKVNEYVEEAKEKILEKEKESLQKLGEKLATQSETLKEEVKNSVLDKPSFDFSLKSLDGNTVKLSDLKGKIVILDFWATWCNPCKMSFPGLQQFYNGIKDRNDVVLLTIDTFEQIPKEDIEKSVKEFIDMNKYTFPVLLDMDNSVVKEYGVNSIPTKVIIDKKGRTRFKTAGFGGEGKMKAELNAQLDFLEKE